MNATHVPFFASFNSLSLQIFSATASTSQQSMTPPFHRVLAAILPLFPTRLRFRLWKYLHSRGRRIWSTYGKAQQIEGGMYIKLSSLVRPTESAITTFVRNHTTIPVPIVIDDITIDGVTALVIGEIPGDTVFDVREEFGMTSEQSRKLSRQLSVLLAQLRAIPPPHNEAVCGWNNTPVRCERVAMDSKPRGPWGSVSEFHSYIARPTIRMNPPAELSERVREQIQMAHARKHRICLTHNDLSPHNVLVDNDFNVTGIIDWEAAAWMPEYWEYTKSLFLPWHRKGWWFDIMTEVFPQYEVERQAEFYIWKYREVYS